MEPVVGQKIRAVPYQQGRSLRIAVAQGDGKGGGVVVGPVFEGRVALQQFFQQTDEFGVGSGNDYRGDTVQVGRISYNFV